jgi:hypothetical protein
MNDRELMQQALDALEGYARNCWCEGGGAPCDAAEALRARLAQPEREWQGLTEYEVGFLTVFDGLHDVEVPLLANFIRHIEAKLKEKNSG